jgi:hypothetical protein
MALVVEDGTGLATAESFGAVAGADAYHSDRGNTDWTGTDEVKEQALRRASTFLSEGFAWKSWPVNGRDQGLAFPRAVFTDNNGYTVSGLPKEIVLATYEIALRELVTPGAMTPDYTPSERLASASVGPISVSYDLSRTDAESARPVLLIVKGIIGPLLAGGGGSRLVGNSNRA